MVATAIAVAGLGLAAGGLFIQQQSAKKAASAQRKQQEIATRQSRRAAIRERVIRSAEVTAAANAYGSSTSSGFEGNIGSLGSQLGSGLGFSTQMSGLSSQISSAQSRMQTGSALSGFGFGLFNASGTFGEMFRAGPPRAGGGTNTQPYRTDAAGRILGGI